MRKATGTTGRDIVDGVDEEGGGPPQVSPTDGHGPHGSRIA